jgi:uncharacterized protein
MKRIAYNLLTDWKNNPRKKPLVLQGARQVGKTWIVDIFGKNEYRHYIKLNFELDPTLNTLFAESLDPAILIEKISLYLNKAINPKDTLLFFDEIQLCPQALTSLKYFYEKAPEYNIIAAGSLLGISLGKQSSFPVGKVNFLSIGPMSFVEYLWAQGENRLGDQLLNTNPDHTWPDYLHEKLSNYFKLYLFIGGMPEAVQEYITHRDIVKVRKIHKEILQAYQNDFSKYSEPKVAVKINEVWQSIPYQLAKENKKFIYSDVKNKTRAVHYEHSIYWLQNAGLIYIVNQLRDIKLPLGGYSDNSKFKLYMLDTGLLGAMLDLTPSTIIDPILIFKEYNGGFVENYVCAELTRQFFNSGQYHKHLYYWTSDRAAEVDFIFQWHDDIIPLEVKSGTNKNTQGLRIYEAKYNPKYIFRASPRNIIKSGNFINMPLYQIVGLPNMLDNLENENESAT